MNKKVLIGIIVGAVILVAVVIGVVVGLPSDPASNCKHDDASKVIVLKAKQPTCQETGLTTGKKCLTCGTILIAQATVDKINCIESQWIVDKKANYDGDGKRHTECTMCGKVFKTETIKFEVSDGFWYVKTGDTCEVFYYTDHYNETNIVVPKYFKGLLVTGLKDGAFMKNETITSVTIPGSVTKIGSYAFDECTSLKYI